MTEISGQPRIVAGYGRSGTTWLQDVVAEANGLRSVFEPLHPDVIAQARPFANGCLGRDDHEPALEEFLARVFAGDFHSVWSDYRIRRDRLLPQPRSLASPAEIKRYFRRFRQAIRYVRRYRDQARRPASLVKMIRANMMLSWLRQTFDARIVFIIRHPGAVVLSQLNAPDIWRPEELVRRYRVDDRLRERLAVPVIKLLDSDLHPVDALALSWSIENVIALDQAAEAGVTIIFYEDLVRNGLIEWRRAIDALDLDVMPNSEAVAQPSQQTWGDNASSPELVAKYASWQDRLDTETSERIARILDIAKVHSYDMAHALPADSRNSG